MSKQAPSGIPLEVIAKGRDLGAVLKAYMKFYGDAQKAVVRPEKTPDGIFADAMRGSVYRIYLLGVEDGMKGGSQNGFTQNENSGGRPG